MRTRVFLSHSSVDKPFAKDLAEAWGRQNVWVDFWSLDAGAMLPQDIAESIQASKVFLLVATRAAMASRWVRYELNIALIHWIKEADCRIIVVRLDDCEIHPELAPFLYVDCPGRPGEAIQKATAAVFSGAETGGPMALAQRRRRIVDRFKEMEAIERLIHERVHFICLYGTYGIGKTSIIERASQEVFNLPLARFPLTEAHGPLRFALELTSRARTPLPSPDSSADQLEKLAIEAIATLMARGYIVFIDNLENALEEDGSIRPYVASVLAGLTTGPTLESPIFLASNRPPALSLLPSDLSTAYHAMHVRGLDTTDLVYCIENWLKLAEPGGAVPDREKLTAAAEHLFGYPLAARLAAHYIVKYSVEGLLADTQHFQQLRIDIAKQLLGRARAKLSELDVGCLEVLAIAESGATLSEMSAALKREPNQIKSAVDRLASTLVVFPERGRIQIHAIVRDYFWHRAQQSGQWKEVAHRLALAAEAEAAKVDSASEEFIHFCSKAYRLFAMSGHLAEAKGLIYAFTEVFRDVSLRLYHAEDNELALEYMTLWLKEHQTDRDTRWFRARCLTRLERYPEAEKELDLLATQGYRVDKLEHARGLLRRDQGNLQAAMACFKKGLADKPDYFPLLRDLGDVLTRLGKNREALQVIERAYELSPRNEYILPSYVDALERNGRSKDALSILEGAIATFPESAAFQHRMATILERLGKLEDAVEHARVAVDLTSNPNSLPEAKLHLASLELKTGNVGGAEYAISLLPPHLNTRESQVRDTTVAFINLRRGKIEEARQLAAKHAKSNDPYCLHVIARIELEDGLRQLGNRQVEAAKSLIRNAQQIVRRALAAHTKNADLKELDARIDVVIKQYRW